MLSKNKIKWIRSLALKKNRDEHQCFLAEGPKVVNDLLGYFPCLLLAGTSDYLTQHPEICAQEVVEATPQQLEQASLLKTPREVLAVFSMKRMASTKESITMVQPLTLVLDCVQDPGNLGTIIRIADWFGIRQVYCSPTSADAYSPKVVQATMGALARVEVHYTDLPAFIRQLPPSTPVYGTFLDGENIYTTDLSKGGVLIMGNEGNGISEEVAGWVNRRLLIPNYPLGVLTSESLNVSIATGIACAEIRRQSQP